MSIHRLSRFVRDHPGTPVGARRRAPEAAGIFTPFGSSPLIGGMLAMY
jgi:hypothetical protein